MSYLSVIENTRAYLCLDCGKCTASCPLARVDSDYSPRRIVERVVLGGAGAVIADPQLWACMTCGLCSARCPSKVDFSRFIVEMRAEAFQAGERGVYAHDGILQQLTRVQAMGMHQERTGWVPDDLDVSDDGEYFYFVGCLPFFDIVFADLGVKPLEIARSAVQLLNRVEIAPIVSNDERCCGADLLLAGDVDSFRRLAALNVKAIKASGAKTVVFTCAECYKAFKTDYPDIVGKLPFELAHLTELLAERVESGQLNFGAVPATVTYHDPCRMGRYLRVHEPPRRVLAGVPELELVEMEDNRERTTCCGSTAWVNCGPHSKSIQQDKLRQARETGAHVMVTACPKCQIHLSCAARDLEGDGAVQVDDVTSLVGRALR